MMDSKLPRTEDSVILSLQLLSPKLFASLLKSLLLISNWKFPRKVAWRFIGARSCELGAVIISLTLALKAEILTAVRHKFPGNKLLLLLLHHYVIGYYITLYYYIVIISLHYYDAIDPRHNLRKVFNNNRRSSGLFVDYVAAKCQKIPSIDHGISRRANDVSDRMDDQRVGSSMLEFVEATPIPRHMRS